MVVVGAGSADVDGRAAFHDHTVCWDARPGFDDNLVANPELTRENADLLTVAENPASSREYFDGAPGLYNRRWQPLGGPALVGRSA